MTKKISYYQSIIHFRKPWSNLNYTQNHGRIPQFHLDLAGEEEEGYCNGLLMLIIGVLLYNPLKLCTSNETFLGMP